MSTTPYPISSAERPRPSGDARRLQPANLSGRLAWGFGLAMTLTILGTLFAGKTVALLSIVPLVVAILFFCARDPVTAVSVLFVYLAMEGMYKYMSGFSQAVYVIRPLLCGIILTLWFLSLKMRGVRLQGNALAPWIGVFCAWGLVEVFNPHGRGILSSAATLTLFYVLPVLFYVLGVNAVKTVAQVETFCYVFLAACTVVSAFAITQFVMGQPWTEAHLPGYHDITQSSWFVQNREGAVTAASFRPASTTDAGGGASTWDCFGMITAVCLLFSPRLSPRQKLGMAVCAAVNMGGLLVDGVRLWLLCGIISVFVFLLLSARSTQDVARSLGTLLLVLIVAFGAFQGAQAISGGILAQRYTDTLANPVAKFQHDRGMNMTAFVHQATDYPLGMGYAYGLGREDLGSEQDSAQLERDGETEFGSICADMGLPGLFLLYALMFGCMAVGWRALRSLRDGHLRTIAAMLLASLVCFLPASFGGPVMQGQIQFWFTAGVLAALPAVERRERQP